jgi:deferrochelatase/peroxidase EfeB
MNDDSLAHDDLSNNNFRFSNPTPAVNLKDGTQASSQFPAPSPDPNGRVCPFVGHIRKVNPRDDSTDSGGPNDTLRRLMLRRGIPYGPPKDRTKLFEDDGIDRGLLFMAYQGSITDQFHFVTQTWANEANAPHDSIPQTGHDPVIGQNAAGCFVRVPVDDDVSRDAQLSLPVDPWVVMTGGGYFFTPSISALAGALSQSVAGPPIHLDAEPSSTTQVLQPTQAAQPKPPRGTRTKSSEKLANAEKGKKPSAPKRKRGTSGRRKK